MDTILNGTDREGTSFWSIFLRPILSKSGERAGRAVSIHFSATQVTKLTVWFGLRRYKIDSSLIRNLGNIQSGRKIILDIDPIFLLIGKSVFDKDGKKLGTISKIEQLGMYNDFDGILVKRKFYLPSTRVEKSQIKVQNKNIILNG
jgi:sporulation protein YlmC with PRC-barrel domain